MKIGEKIASVREVLGLSQRELAKRSNLTSPAVCQYESGKRIPDLRSFVAISRAFGMKVDKLLEDTDI